MVKTKLTNTLTNFFIHQQLLFSSTFSLLFRIKLTENVKFNRTHISKDYFKVEKKRLVSVTREIPNGRHLLFTVIVYTRNIINRKVSDISNAHCSCSVCFQCFFTLLFGIFSIYLTFFGCNCNLNIL